MLNIVEAERTVTDEDVLVFLKERLFVIPGALLVSGSGKSRRVGQVLTVFERTNGDLLLWTIDQRAMSGMETGAITTVSIGDCMRSEEKLTLILPPQRDVWRRWTPEVVDSTIEHELCSGGLNDLLVAAGTWGGRQVASLVSVDASDVGITLWTSALGVHNGRPEPIVFTFPDDVTMLLIAPSESDVLASDE